MLGAVLIVMSGRSDIPVADDVMMSATAGIAVVAAIIAALYGGDGKKKR